MAKAREIPYHEPASNPHSWLAAVLLVRFDEVAGYAGDALETDNVEAIHDIRVATRRLRSVLRDFEGIIGELPDESLREDLSNLSDLLGAVRDEDVAIAALEQFSTEAANKKIRDGIEDLIAERREIRKTAFRDLHMLLSPKILKELRSRLGVALESTREQLGLFRSLTIIEAAREAITARSNDLFERGNVIYKPNKIKGLHKLRIAAKRLRYAIELFAACLGEAVVPFAADVKKLQDHLGETHDCDVWIKDLGERLKDKDRADTSLEAEAWLLSEFVKKRSKAYRAALKLWVKLERTGFAERLHASLVE